MSVPLTASAVFSLGSDGNIFLFKAPCAGNIGGDEGPPPPQETRHCQPQVTHKVLIRRIRLIRYVPKGAEERNLRREQVTHVTDLTLPKFPSETSRLALRHEPEQKF